MMRVECKKISRVLMINHHEIFVCVLNIFTELKDIKNWKNKLFSVLFYLISFELQFHENRGLFKSSQSDQKNDQKNRTICNQKNSLLKGNESLKILSENFKKNA